MQCLPRWIAFEANGHFPLSDGTAAALISALAKDGISARTVACEAALCADPALVVWCALHPRRPPAPPRDCRELAEWLALDCLTVLQWSPEEVRNAAPRAPSRCAHQATLAARGLLLAARAERSLQELAARGEVRLVAFLSFAFEWLAAISDAPDNTAAARSVPPWLQNFLAELQQPNQPHPAREAVARALRESEQRDDPEAIRELAARWAQPLPGVGEALPSLTARLARLESLERDFQGALQREKLASLQKLAYGASHEINNPLANIATRAQTLLQGETDPERRRALCTINDQAFRGFEMIANMMLFAKPPELDLAPVDANALAGRVLEEMTPSAREQGTDLLGEFEDDAACLQADGVQLAVLLRALVRNALEAVECGGVVTVSVRRGEGHELRFLVHDDGPGLCDEARRHLFDPFYSGREAGRGLGFGLSWCWAIVERHQGRIEFQSDDSQGTTFVVVLPLAGPSR